MPLDWVASGSDSQLAQRAAATRRFGNERRRGGGGQRKIGVSIKVSAKSQTFTNWAMDIASMLGQLSGAGRR